MSGKKEWPLDVYRRRSRGWEKCVPGGVGANHVLQPNAMGKPMPGCVYIKRFRLKINLKDEKAGLMEVIRRNKCILFAPKSNRHAQILLRFHTLKDCLDFSDELMASNQSLYAAENSKRQENKQSAMNPKTNPVKEAGMDRNDLISQIAQLLHDESFLNFTAKVENLIKTSPDGIKILQALQGSGSVGKAAES